MLIEQVCCAIGNGAAVLRLVSSRRSQDFERAAKTHAPGQTASGVPDLEEPP
jgi:hypothetical protein